MATHITPTITGFNVFRIVRAGASGPTDTTFRTWLGYVEDALTALGMTRTADTGQYDPATVTLGTARSYSLWNFNDTADATDPLILRIAFSTSAASPGGLLSMWAEVGRGSNGSGTLTGVISIEKALASGSTSLGIQDPFMRACLTDDGFLTLEMCDANASPGANRGFISVARMAYEPGDVMVQNSSSFNTLTVRNPVAFSPVTAQSDWLDVNGVSNADNAFGCLYALPWGSLSSEPGFTSVFPAVVGRSSVSGAAMDYTPTGFCCFKTGEYPSGTSFTVSLDGGTARTYMPSNIQSPSGTYGASNSVSLAYVWE